MKVGKKSPLLAYLVSLTLLCAAPVCAEVPARPGNFAALVEQGQKLEATREQLLATQMTAQALGRMFAGQVSDQGLDRAYVADWLQQHQGFHQQLNHFIVSQHKYFIEQAHATYEQLGVHEKISKASFLKRHKLQEFARMAEEGYLAYQENIGLFGESKDYRRINGYVKFFRNYRKLLQGLSLLDKEERSHAATVRSAMVRVGARQVGLLKQLFFPTKRPSPDHHYTPLLNKESHALQKLFAEMEFEVSVEGRENLPPQQTGEISDEKEVNIFVVMHGNPFFDEGVKAHLDLPHYMIVWAVGVSGMPAFMQKALTRSSSILPVGHGHDTVELAVQALAKKFSNNIAIHPQGAVSIFNEVMPLHNNFSAKFLPRLKAEGYRIRLIPITSVYPPVFIAGRYFDGLGAGESAKITIKVHESVPPQVVDELLALPGGDGEKVINHFVRSIWLEHMPTNEQQLMGQLRMGHVADLMGPLLGAAND